MGQLSVPDDTRDYRRILVKGMPCPLPENLKVSAKANGVTVTLTEANGDFSAANFSGFNPNTMGSQTGHLLIQPENITVDVPLYVLDVEPELYFDYGYMRHAGNPNGLPPGASSGYYTVPAGRSLVLSPVVFYMTTAEPSYSWSVGGGLPYTTSGAGNKYLRVSPAAQGTYTVSVTVSAGSVSKTASTTVICTEALPGTPPAALPEGNAGGVNIRNIAPGQFTKSGTGYGWSLGAYGGYWTWAHRAVNTNTRSIQISGNPMATWSEPGIVWVSIDANGNGQPDDPWYELKGGDDENAQYASQVSRLHAVKYKLGQTSPVINQYGQTNDEVFYVDSKGRTGWFPGGWSTAWGVAETPGAWVTFTGTMLRYTAGGIVCAVNMGATPNHDWGYVDAAHPALGNDWDKFNIQHAILADGSPANLPYIDFIKVQTGIFHREGGFGEISTEIASADGLGHTTDFPLP
jgi:hypothetical protein